MLFEEHFQHVGGTYVCAGPVVCVVDKGVRQFAVTAELTPLSNNRAWRCGHLVAACSISRFPSSLAVSHCYVCVRVCANDLCNQFTVGRTYHLAIGDAAMSDRTFPRRAS